MRFITEYEISGNELKYTPNPVIEHRQSCAEDKLGEIIAESFGFKEAGFLETNGTGLTGIRKSLEIEAFPMDKWIEFKDKIMFYLQECEDKDELTESLWVLRMIKELESFGKPAGEVK